MKLGQDHPGMGWVAGLKAVHCLARRIVALLRIRLTQTEPSREMSLAEMYPVAHLLPTVTLLKHVETLRTGQHARLAQVSFRGGLNDHSVYK
ncbi:MAG: hypothetical protein EXR90_08250 [Methyloglobulus sp.]|nr:hypothetical protein [Methyloglobulus sp.]